MAVIVFLREFIYQRSVRGDDQKQLAMFSSLTLARRMPADHPAQQIREFVDRALERTDAELEKLYLETGRLSIASERLLQATLLMIFYSIRSKRQLMEQMNYMLLFRWFVGLKMDDAVWGVTVFTNNRERLIEGAVSQRFWAEVCLEAGKTASRCKTKRRNCGKTGQEWRKIRSTSKVKWESGVLPQPV